MYTARAVYSSAGVTGTYLHCSAARCYASNAHAYSRNVTESKISGKIWWLVFIHRRRHQRRRHLYYQQHDYHCLHDNISKYNK